MTVQILKHLLKIISFMIIIFIYLKKFHFLFKYKIIFDKYFLIEQKVYFQTFLKIRNIFDKNNISLLEKNKKQEVFKLLSYHNLSYHNGTNITSLDKIFYKGHLRFGNCLVALNKLIFYCEIIECKSIILDKNEFWFIKNKIFIPKINISIETGDFNESINYYYTSHNLFFSTSIYKPEIRIHLLRKEIISNLPKIKYSKDILYMHVRSGDIFNRIINRFYSQPPLCFYQSILNNYNFPKIYLISENKNNPIIKKLVNQFPNIINNKNNLKIDISLLINAYKIVASISSLLNLVIQLNYNLDFYGIIIYIKQVKKYYSIIMIYIDIHIINLLSLEWSLQVNIDQ